MHDVRVGAGGPVAAPLHVRETARVDRDGRAGNRVAARGGALVVGVDARVAGGARPTGRRLLLVVLLLLLLLLKIGLWGKVILLRTICKITGMIVKSLRML